MVPNAGPLCTKANAFVFFAERNSKFAGPKALGCERTCPYINIYLYMFIYTRITILVPRLFGASKKGCEKRRKYVLFSTFAEKHGTVCKRGPPPTLNFRLEKRRKNEYFRNQGPVARVWGVSAPRNAPLPSFVAKVEPGPPQLRCGSQMAPLWLPICVFLSKISHFARSSKSTSTRCNLILPMVKNR